MRIENGGVFCSDRFGNALLHLQNLHTRLNKGRFEARDFIAHLGRRNAVPHHLIKLIAHDMDLPAGDPGRDASSFKANFFWRVAAHPLGRVRQMSNIANLLLTSGTDAALSRRHSGTSVTQSSLKRALISSPSSSIAFSASGPSQRIRSFDPCPAASIINPMILLPFTSSPSFETQISERCRLAMRTNMAAGLAWSPRRFTIGTSFSTFWTGAERPVLR